MISLCTLEEICYVAPTKVDTTIEKFDSIRSNESNNTNHLLSINDSLLLRM